MKKLIKILSDMLVVIILVVVLYEIVGYLDNNKHTSKNYEEINVIDIFTDKAFSDKSLWHYLENN